MNSKSNWQQIYILRSSAQRFAAIHTIDNLPLDADHPMEIVIREHTGQRTLSQNGYYFMRIGEIAQQAWHEGRQYHKTAWHEVCAEDLMPEMITTKDGNLESKWIDKPNGGRSVRSTTDLDKRCFALYTQIVEAWAVTELGVQFKTHENPNQS